MTLYLTSSLLIGHIKVRHSLLYYGFLLIVNNEPGQNYIVCGSNKVINSHPLPFTTHYHLYSWLAMRLLATAKLINKETFMFPLSNELKILLCSLK